MRSSISSLVRIWKIHVCHSGARCGFVRILEVVYFPVKHLCLYNDHTYISIPIILLLSLLVFAGPSPIFQTHSLFGTDVS